MAEEDNGEEVEEVEEVEEEEEEEPEPDTQEAAMLHFGRYSEMRHAVPWQQKTKMEKASYYIDRAFLVFVIVFLVAVIGEFSYKMWYVTNIQKIKEFVSDLVSWLFSDEKQKKIEL